MTTLGTDRKRRANYIEYNCQVGFKSGLVLISSDLNGGPAL